MVDKAIFVGHHLELIFEETSLATGEDLGCSSLKKIPQMQ